MPKILTPDFSFQLFDYLFQYLYLFVTFLLIYRIELYNGRTSLIVSFIFDIESFLKELFVTELGPDSYVICRVSQWLTIDFE